MHRQGCRPWGCRGCLAPPDFGRSVNPISTRGRDYAHLTTTGTPGFSDHLTALESYVNKAIEEVNFTITEEPSKNKIDHDISDEANIKKEVFEPPVYEYEKANIEFSTNGNEKCQTCGLEFGNKAVLKIHNSIVHPEGPKMLAQQSTDKNGEKSPTQNYSGQEHKFEYVILNEERLLIAQQMRQHIQLLTQMSLLTAKDDYWQELHTDCRGMLSELMNRSFNQQYSIYAQDNLFPSIQVYYPRTLEYMDRTLKLPDTYIVGGTQKPL